MMSNDITDSEAVESVLIMWRVHLAQGLQWIHTIGVVDRLSGSLKLMIADF